jgi:general secretion pathway protein G
MSRPGARGFTLIELLITVVIVGLLATMAMPVAELSVQRSRERELREALREMRTALDAYKQAADEGRIVVDRFKSGYPPNLNVLVEGVADARSNVRERRLYFLRRVPRDPFADPALAAASSWGLRSYSSPPDAPSAGDDVFDVYSLSSETGLNGVPYKLW